MKPAPVAHTPNFELGWEPVDASNLVTLPHPWPTLLAQGFDPFLYNRVERFWTAVVNDGKTEFLHDPIVLLGENFLQDHMLETTSVETGDFSGSRWTAACRELRNEFLHIPPLLFETIATLGNRPDATHETSILNVQEHLPYPWGVCDAALHALGCSYGLFLHVEERLRSATGHILLHGCGCDHVVAGVEEVAGPFPLLRDTPAQKHKAAKEWLDHFLGQLYLIFVVGMPFRMNPEDLQSTKVVLLRS
jgi:hypothetical protein